MEELTAEIEEFTGRIPDLGEQIAAMKDRLWRFGMVASRIGRTFGKRIPSHLSGISRNEFAHG